MYMANNPFQKGWISTPFFSRFSCFLLFFSLVFLGLSIPSNAQKISKYFTSSIQENGILYFIKPIKGFKSSSDHKTFTYDITYLTSKDSVTLNFLLKDKDLISPKILIFKLFNDSIQSSLKKIFVEAHKSKWLYRYSATFSVKDMQKFYASKVPPTLKIITQKQEKIILDHDHVKWKKQSSILSKIFQMIRMNQE